MKWNAPYAVMLHRKERQFNFTSASARRESALESPTFPFPLGCVSQMFCGNTLQFDSVYQRPVRCLAAAVKRHPADSILLLFAFYTYFIYVYAV